MVGVFSAEKQREYLAECQDYILPMLKYARNRFPAQKPVYQNLKFILDGQVHLVSAALSAIEQPQEEGPGF